MTYTVIWLTSAEEQLKALWRRCDDPGEVLSAARKIEAKLIREAPSAGESRQSSDDRVIFESPLGIAFWVSSIDHVVAITSVWWIGRRDR